MLARLTLVAFLSLVAGPELMPAPIMATVAAQQPRKIFISVDMEGITGVVQPAQLGPEGFEYQRAREWMTGEVNAAIAGIRDAGPADIVVCDSHGNGQSVLIDLLPDDVRIVRGFPRPMEMMQGIDESFAAAVFIGYHASEWTANAVRGHTISSARLLGVKLNGQEVSEGIYNAAPYRMTAPIALEVGFKLTIDAERAAFVPGLTRSDAHSVKGTFKDMTEITRLLQVLTSLELP